AGLEHAIADLAAFVPEESNAAEKRAVEGGVARGHQANGHALLYMSPGPGRCSVRYSNSVRLRLTTLLLAALTAVATSVGVPASRIAATRASYELVSVPRRARHTERQALELP